MKWRWAFFGVLAGGLLALLAFLPAAWMAKELAAATAGRLLLAEAQGTLWQGNAVLVLTGGADSRDAAALPGRLHWRLTWHGGAPALRLQQACCMDAPVLLRWRPGLAANRFELLSLAAQGGEAAANAVIGHWPVAWLAGLGAPLNTLRLSGTMQLSGQNLSLETVQGRLVLGGRAELAMDQVASRLSTLEVLGDYRLSLQGDPRGQAANLQLRTTRGALQLSGEGQWAAAKFRFNGQASAAPGFESALNNLLNIIGRRQGAQSLISIG